MRVCRPGVSSANKYDVRSCRACSAGVALKPNGGEASFAATFVLLLLAVVALPAVLTGCAGIKPYSKMYEHEFYWKGDTKNIYKTKLLSCKGNASVVEKNDDQRGVTKVTSFNGTMIGNLSITGDGKTLGFQAAKANGETSIMTVSIDGTEMGNVVFAKKGCIQESPWIGNDGKDIYFCSNITGVPRIWAMRLDDIRGNLKDQTGGEGAQFEPSVSDDGRTTVFTSFLPGSKEEAICVADDSGGITYLRKGGCPRVSGDGKQIVFLSPGEESGKYNQVWVMDVHGKPMRQITNLDGECRDASFSPDGKAIVFSCDALGEEASGKRDFNIWIADMQDGTQKQMTTNSAADVSPVWSKDGRYIYFCSNRGMKWNIWRLNLDEKLRLAAPVEVKASIDNGGVKVNWKSIEGKGIMYAVYYTGAGQAVWQKANKQPVSEASYTVTGLKPSAAYRFKVTATGPNGVESGDSAAVLCITPNIKPPEGLTAKLKSDGNGIGLYWKTVQTAVGYNVYMKPDFGKVWWKMNESPVKAKEYTIGEGYLRNREDYVFKICSLDETGFESVRSEGASLPLQRKRC